MEHSYKTRPPDVKVKIIKCLIRLSSNIGRNNEATFTAVCSLLADMFVVKFRRGEFLSTSISDEDVEVLRRVVDSFMKRKTKGQPPIDEEFRCDVFKYVHRNEMSLFKCSFFVLVALFLYFLFIKCLFKLHFKLHSSLTRYVNERFSQ